MADAVNIDWGLLKPPDYVSDYANAFAAGRQMAQQNPTPPSVNAFTTGGAGGAAGPAPAQPDPLDDRIGALNPAERARATQQADLLQSLGTGLRAYPYAARPGILAHLAPTLIARGVPAEALAGFDPTDTALNAAVVQARALGARLASATPDPP